MNIKHLIFALFTAATLSSLVSCDESTPQPTPETCVTCENETIVDSLFEYEAVVKKHTFNSEGTSTRYILSIRKLDLNLGNNDYSLTIDSLFYPCPPLSKEYEEIDLRVKITGYTKSCTGVLGDPMSRPHYGRKLDLVKIEKY
ncbi:hypothetical protein [Bernardetia sp. MNP-M8]|uniref:hypothetical protein n=1 Tax=Bernardetia sp. MNP-M8 TaxID=3127470 RepID=UPI0030CCE546